MCFCNWRISLKKLPSGFTYFAAYIRLHVSTCATAESRSMTKFHLMHIEHVYLSSIYLKTFILYTSFHQTISCWGFCYCLLKNETPTSMCPYIQCNIICNGKTMNRTIDEDKDDAWDSGWSLKIIAEGIQPRQVTQKPFYRPLYMYWGILWKSTIHV